LIWSQSVGAWTEPSQPVALVGLTVLELTGVDRTGLISELFAVLADMGCSVVAASAWTHRGRLACLVYLRDVDAVRVARIESRLGALFRGVSDDASAGVVTRFVKRPKQQHHQRAIRVLFLFPWQLGHVLSSPTSSQETIASTSLI
jgi:predicted amino acid-binding ACT domain protein